LARGRNEGAGGADLKTRSVVIGALDKLQIVRGKEKEKLGGKESKGAG